MASLIRRATASTYPYLPTPPSFYQRQRYCQPLPSFPKIQFRGAVTLYQEARLKPPPGPVALHVCCESWYLALRKYEMAFGGRALVSPADFELATLWEEHGLGDRKVWVNRELDTILIVDADERMHSLEAISYASPYAL